jgi:putative ABC transport system permease protein
MAMLRLGFRNLFQSRARLLMSMGGLSLALTLSLALDGVVAGAESMTSAYIDQSGADVWVSQAGVRNLHMASSNLPAPVAAQIAALPGVASATPIAYMSNIVSVGGQKQLVYVFGLPDDPAAGAPRDVTGSPLPHTGQAVLSSVAARQAGQGLGGTVTILGRAFGIAGLAGGAVSSLTAPVFITLADFQALQGTPGVISYVLVRARLGQDAARLADEIESDVGGVSAAPTAAFSAHERLIVEDMVTGIVDILDLVGFVVALSVMALTVYTATLARRSEYGVLKAVGARNLDLYRVVAAQAVISLALGFLAALAITLALSVLVPLVEPQLAIELTAGSVARVGAFALVVGVLSALLPVRQIAGLDPVAVFKRRVA